MVAGAPAYVIDAGTSGAGVLFAEPRCEVGGTYANTADVLANPVLFPAVNLPASDPAWLDCRDPKITLLKEISIDGVDGTYFDANDVASAPTALAPANAWYRITVENTGDADLTNVLVNDATLGLVNFPIPDADMVAGAQRM